MKKVVFICRKCKHREPIEDENGKCREWQFCCGEAMEMGVVIGRIVNPCIPDEQEKEAVKI